MKKVKVNMTLSLREARVLLRALRVADNLTVDYRRDWCDQSPVNNAVVSLASKLRCAVSDSCHEAGFSCDAWDLAFEWGKEPIKAELGSTYNKKEVA